MTASLPFSDCLPATALYKSTCLIVLVQFSSLLVSEKSEVRNPKTIFSCQTALTKVMSTCSILVNLFVLAKFSSLVCENPDVMTHKLFLAFIQP